MIFLQLWNVILRRPAVVIEPSPPKNKVDTQFKRGVDIIRIYNIPCRVEVCGVFHTTRRRLLLRLLYNLSHSPCWLSCSLLNNIGEGAQCSYVRACMRGPLAIDLSLLYVYPTFISSVSCNSSEIFFVQLYRLYKLTQLLLLNTVLDTLVE